MCETGYSVRDLVADIHRLRASAPGEAQLLEAMRERVKRLQLMKHAWLRPSMCVPGAGPGQAGIHRLHEEADHTIAIFVVTWAPGEETPPHDHRTWAVIAGLEGQETQHWWRRLDDGAVEGVARIERSASERIDAATVLTMGSDAIHSLHNDSGGLSVTLHVYGVNVDYTDRRKYDAQAGISSPYRFGGTVAPASAA